MTPIPRLMIDTPQIVERIESSEDFKGLFMLMSEDFGASLGLTEEYSLRNNIYETGFYPLESESMDSVITYFRMLQKLLRTDNPHKCKVATHLTIADLYGIGNYMHTNVSSNKQDRSTELVNRFMELVRDNCRKHRDMEFYADKLGISAKHLDMVVSKTTGTKAINWIEKFTILNARNLLKVTTMTVSQISEELNFGSQSEFGKYFKKATGMSPLVFRRNE